MSAAGGAAAPEGRTNPLLVAAVVLIGVEALALAGLAAGVVVDGVRAGTSVVSALALAAMYLAFVAFLAACGRALLRGMRWPKAPVIVIQLLTILVAVQAVLSPLWWLGAAALLVAGLVVVLLLLPGVAAVTSRTQRVAGDDSAP